MITQETPLFYDSPRFFVTVIHVFRGVFLHPKQKYISETTVKKLHSMKP